MAGEHPREYWKFNTDTKHALLFANIVFLTIIFPQSFNAPCNSFSQAVKENIYVKNFGDNAIFLKRTVVEIITKYYKNMFCRHLKLKRQLSNSQGKPNSQVG